MLGLASHRLFGKSQRPLSIAAEARARCLARTPTEPEPELPDAPTGGGWFDSSFALQEGLTVVEHHSMHGDTLELAVALWLH
jgi:hypothetical protein